MHAYTWHLATSGTLASILHKPTSLSSMSKVLSECWNPRDREPSPISNEMGRYYILISVKRLLCDFFKKLMSYLYAISDVITTHIYAISDFMMQDNIFTLKLLLNNQCFCELYVFMNISKKYIIKICLLKQYPRDMYKLMVHNNKTVIYCCALYVLFGIQ